MKELKELLSGKQTFAYQDYDHVDISTKTMPWITVDNCLSAAERTTLDDRKKDTKTTEENCYSFLNHGRAFFKQVILSQKVPSVDEFTHNYWNTYSVHLEKHHKKHYADLNTKEFKRGVEARCYRAALTFLTELHAYSLFQSSFPDCESHKTIKLDSSGLDWVVERGGQIFGVRFYVKTSRAKGYASEKLEHLKHKDFAIINLTYDLGGEEIRKLSNGFVVCTDYHMNQIKKIFDGQAIPDATLVSYTI
jgi:hypothetical protein